MNIYSEYNSLNELGNGVPGHICSKTLISFFIFYTLSLDVHTIFLFDGHVCVLESKTVHIDC